MSQYPSQSMGGIQEGLSQLIQNYKISPSTDKYISINIIYMSDQKNELNAPAIVAEIKEKVKLLKDTKDKFIENNPHLKSKLDDISSKIDAVEALVANAQGYSKDILHQLLHNIIRVLKDISKILPLVAKLSIDLGTTFSDLLNGLASEIEKGHNLLLNFVAVEVVLTVLTLGPNVKHVAEQTRAAVFVAGLVVADKYADQKLQAQTLADAALAIRGVAKAVDGSAQADAGAILILRDVVDLLIAFLKTIAGNSC